MGHICSNIVMEMLGIALLEGFFPAIILPLILGMVAFIYQRQNKFLITSEVESETYQEQNQIVSVNSEPRRKEKSYKLRLGSGRFHQVVLTAIENLLQQLYNIKVKVECQNAPFRSESELPMVCATDLETTKNDLKIRLDQALSQENEYYHKMLKLIENIIETGDVTILLKQFKMFISIATNVMKEYKVDNEICGFFPSGMSGYGGTFTATASSTSELTITWKPTVNSKTGQESIILATQGLLQTLKQEKRQPTVEEFIALQVAYSEITTGQSSCQLKQGALFLGTPGFRRHTQSYMSLTDPGDGHVMGTTKKQEWMRGAIVHVEHLERPHHHPRMKIESYRIPSLIDFCKVRLHVGNTSPTTSFMGRRVKDSDDGDFDRDFVKIVHMTSASCTAMFANGAAECKIAMEGLKTSEAVRYMQGLKGQVLKTHRQYLSAAWNLNQTVIDDFQNDQPKILNDRVSIAKRAIEITCYGGFEKVTWDGASDTYPSQCIMHQLSEETALTIVHEAHERGLVTYFSSGFRFAQIPLAIYSGVDGVGIGGAQVLRYMDKETGMHGPYMEENIGRILATRDEAASSTRGRGVHLLCRLDTMYFEGSITATENKIRKQLFEALVEKDEHQIDELIKILKHIVNHPDDGEMPLVGTASRLTSADEPMLSLAAPSDNIWNSFVEQLRTHVNNKAEGLLYEEYVSQKWANMRQTYHSKICHMITRQSNTLTKSKHFK